MKENIFIENSKICFRCKEKKSLDDFGSDKGHPTGFSSYCRICARIRYKIWYDRNEGKTCARYFQKNKTKLKEKEIIYRLKNQERIARVGKEYNLRNSEKIREYEKRLYATNFNYRFGQQLSNRIRGILGSKKKKQKTKYLLGCSPVELKKYLESKFKDGMTWENYGKPSYGWHIDHILPCRIFNFNKKSHQRICFHYTNLQPLWGCENVRKSGKILPYLKHIADNIDKMSLKQYLKLINQLNNEA